MLNGARNADKYHCLKSRSCQGCNSPSEQTVCSLQIKFCRQSSPFSRLIISRILFNFLSMSLSYFGCDSSSSAKSSRVRIAAVNLYTVHA